MLFTQFANNATQRFTEIYQKEIYNIKLPISTSIMLKNISTKLKF